MLRGGGLEVRPRSHQGQVAAVCCPLLPTPAATLGLGRGGGRWVLMPWESDRRPGLAHASSGPVLRTGPLGSQTRTRVQGQGGRGDQKGPHLPRGHSLSYSSQDSGLLSTLQPKPSWYCLGVLVGRTVLSLGGPYYLSYWLWRTQPFPES